MNKSHKRSIRRDRRKAKESGWTRPGNSTNKIGHGGGGMKTPKMQANKKVNKTHIGDNYEEFYSDKAQILIKDTI